MIVFVLAILLWQIGPLWRLGQENQMSFNADHLAAPMTCGNCQERIDLMLTSKWTQIRCPKCLVWFDIKRKDGIPYMDGPCDPSTIPLPKKRRGQDAWRWRGPR